MIALLAVAAQAKDVCASGCDYATIQAAIDDGQYSLTLTDADSYVGAFVVPPGQTVSVDSPVGAAIVAEEPCCEPVATVIGATLELRDLAVLGSAETTILVDQGTLDLDGVTLTDAGSGFLDLGGGILATDATIGVHGGGFSACASYEGAAIEATDSDVTIDSGATFLGNAAVDAGGAILVRGGTLLLEDADLDGNGAYAGGGLYAEDADVTIAGTTRFRFGGAAWGAGAAIVRGTLTAVAPDVRFDHGAATEAGGALYLESVTAATLDGVEVDQNQAPDGGGIFALDTPLVITASALHDNPGAFGTVLVGGAIELQGGSLVADATDFDANAAAFGGHVTGLDSPLTFTDGTLSDGWADLGGGAVYAASSSAVADVLLDGVVAAFDATGLDGGVVYAESYGGSVAVTAIDLDVTSASAWAGGAIAVWNASLTVTGGSFSGGFAATSGGDVDVAAAAGPIVLDGATFGGSYAPLGGSVHVADTADLTITGCTFDAPLASDVGGAVSLARVDAATVTGSAFCGAAVLPSDGPAYRSAGGALAVEDSCTPGSCVVEGDVFAATTAGHGGALYVAGSALTVRHATFAAPSSEDGAVAAVDAGGDLSLVAGVILLPEGDGISITSGSATLDTVAVDAGPDWADDAAEVGVTVAPVPLLVVPGPADALGIPPCGGETRIHPQSANAGAWKGTDLGAYGAPALPVAWTEDLDGDGAGWRQDCDDADPRVSGLAPELCDNGLDDDCDGLVDRLDDSAERDWFADDDGDGHAGTVPVAHACIGPPGAVDAPGDDCDDGDPDDFPGNPERCDAQDQDCDGQADEDLAEVPGWTVDLDGDGFGVQVDACPEPDGVAEVPEGDCDDLDPGVHPGAAEIDDDGVDEDCDGLDPSAFVAGGACGCASSRPPVLLVLVLVLGAVRRRR